MGDSAVPTAYLAYFHHEEKFWEQCLYIIRSTILRTNTTTSVEDRNLVFVEVQSMLLNFFTVRSKL